MSPDSLSSEPLDQLLEISEAFYAPYLFGGALLIASGVGVAFAVFAVVQAKQRGFKLTYLLAALVTLAVAAGLAAMGVNFIKEGNPGPPSEAGNIAVVQEWAASSYGVSVSDSDAKRMAGEIVSQSDRSGRTFTVQGPDGVLEVKLTAAEDGSFHMVQTAAELPLARIGD